MRQMDTGGSGGSRTSYDNKYNPPQSVVRKAPTLPKAPVKYTPAPAPATYYNNYKGVSKAAAGSAVAKKTVAVSNSNPYTNAGPGKSVLKTASPSYSTDKNGRPIYNGTSTSRNAQNQWDASHGSSITYPSSSGISSSTTAAAAAPAYDPMKDPTYLASMAKLNDLWNQASGYKTQIDQMMKDGFTYDVNTDASYQALEAQAQKQATVASAGAMEDMNDRGILNSTITSDRLGQIQQTAQDAVTAQIPTLQNAAYGKYMDKLGQLNNMWNATVGQAQQERAFGQSEKQWNLGYNLDLQKFNTDNAHWQQQFDYGKQQDAINNGFKQDQLNLDHMQYTLQALKQQQDMMGVNNTQATQAAISELLGAKSADDALNIMTSKAQQYYEGGVNFTQLMNALDKRWNGFSSKASSKTTSFK